MLPLLVPLHHRHRHVQLQRRHPLSLLVAGERVDTPQATAAAEAVADQPAAACEEGDAQLGQLPPRFERDRSRGQQLPVGLQREVSVDQRFGGHEERRTAAAAATAEKRCGSRVNEAPAAVDLDGGPAVVVGVPASTGRPAAIAPVARDGGCLELTCPS